MRARLGLLAVLMLGVCQASAEPVAAPPVLDCSKGFDGLQKWAAWLPGAERTTRDGQDIIGLAAPDVWRVELTFLQTGDPGYPAIILRKFLKQVTGVWTAQSQACSFGDKAQFPALLARLKAEDTRLTNVSREEADRQKRDGSSLSPMP
jgi:hypothetical protein